MNCLFQQGENVAVGEFVGFGEFVELLEFIEIRDWRYDKNIRDS